MGVDLQTLLTLLQQSQLLTAHQSTIVAAEARAAGVTAESLVRSLVKRRWLTPWQGKQLLSGRSTFVLGKYKILEQLGKGGMGSVYKAEQAPLGRIVAIKMMSSELVKRPEAVARFHREIQAAASLNHPNIVAAFDADCVRNRHFLVMEYVEGETLAEIAGRLGRLPIDEACEYIRQVALGLQHAFERGMVHRDIKPSNLILTQSPAECEGGENSADNDVPLVKILDMGLARFTSEHAEEGLTNTGQVMGTPDYVSPEQAQNTRMADIRSDIFSLGCTLFRLLTGAIPFGGENTMEKLMARGMHDAPRVRSLRPDVPRELDAIVAKMLARNPAERFQTPADVANSLAQFAAPRESWTLEPDLRSAAGAATLVSDSPAAQLQPAPGDGTLLIGARSIDASPTPATAGSDTRTIESDAGDFGHGGVTEPLTPQRSPTTFRQKSSRKGTGRGPLLAGIIAGVAAVVALGGVWIWQTTGVTTLEVDWPEAERSKATLEVDGRPISRVEKGPLRFTGDPGRRTLRLSRDGYEPIEASLQLPRGATRTYRPKWKPTAGTVRRQELQSLAQRVAEAADGKSPPANEMLAELRTEVHRWRFRSPSPEERTQLAGLPQKLPWPLDELNPRDIPELERMIFTPQSSPRAVASLVGVFGDSRLKMTDAPLAMGFSRDGSSLWTCTTDGRIVAWELSSGKPRRAYVVPRSLTTAAFFPDLSRVVVADDRGVISVCGLLDGKIEFELTDESTAITFLRTSADGGRIVSGDDHSLIKVWDAATRSKLREIQGRPSGLSTLSLSGDGRRVAAACVPQDKEREPPALHVWDADSGEVILSEKDESQTWGLCLSPDGRLLAQLAPTTRIRDLTNGGVSLNWLLEGERIGSAAFSLEGSRLVLARQTVGSVEVWDVATGELQALCETKIQSPLSLVLNTDASRAAIVGYENSLQLWNLTEKKAIHVPEGLTGGMHTAIVSPDGSLLAVGSWRSLMFWDIARRTVRDTFLRTELTFTLQNAPDGETLFAGGDTMINRWDWKWVSPKADMPGPQNWTFSVAFSPDGKRVAATDYTWHLYEWDLPTGELRRKLKKPGGSATYSRDGAYLAAVGGGKVFVLDRQSGEPVGDPFGVDIEFAAFPFQGESLITVSSDGQIAAWDPPKFAQRQTTTAFEGPRKSTHAQLSGSGRLAVLTRIDDAVALWSLGQEAPVMLGDPIRFSSPLARISGAFFTPDERHLLLCATNGTVAVFRLRQNLVEP